MRLVWRLLTAPFMHAGLLHVALNMSAWVPLGSSLERLVGTVQFAHLTLVFAALGGLIHALAGALVSGGGGRAHECAVGLSGVLFSLIVVDSHLTPAATRTLFGFVSVPTRWYPLALLALLQLLLPNASVLGHLSGVLVGYAFIWGWLNWCVLGQGSVSALERSTVLASTVARSSFIFSAGLLDPHGGGLPRWITAPGAGSEGVAWRTPAWLSRAIAQASASAGMSSGTGGPSAAAAGTAAFVGRSRTVGGQTRAGAGEVRAAVEVPMQPMQPPAAAAAQPVSAAEARARAARAAEARLLGGGGPAAAAASRDSVPPGLSQLVAMGFPESDAREALVATHGDISAALARLAGDD